MFIRTICFLLILLTTGSLPLGCGATTPIARELTMEVPQPQDVIIGKIVTIQVTLRDLPVEGSIIKMTWDGFRVKGEVQEATVEIPASPGISGVKNKMNLLWESSVPGILGGLANAPTFSSATVTEVHPGATGLQLEFYFDTLLAGTTELSLTLVEANGNQIKRMVNVTVTN